MPIQKPSPHRFIAPNPPPAQTPKAKPKSNLRHAVTAHTGKQTSELQFKKITPAKRFVVARTHQPHTADATPQVQDRVEDKASDTPPLYTPRPKVLRKCEEVESIEEASQSSPSRRPDDDAFNVVQTTEHDTLLAEDEESERHNVRDGDDGDDDDDEILFVSELRSKRRRTSSHSPALQPYAPPETPRLNSASHRFRFPPPLPQTSTLSSNLNALTSSFPTAASTTSASPAQRPHFLLPPHLPTPQKPPRPLPEIFSPSRKNQKYIPHGLASAMQSCIIETANMGFAAQERSAGMLWGKEREDGMRLKLKIVKISADDLQEIECSPGSVVFVSGELEPGICHTSRALSLVAEGEVVRVLLAGQGGARGAGGVRVCVGGVVGIRAPTWDIDVGGEKWAVGVDWVVL